MSRPLASADPSTNRGSQAALIAEVAALRGHLTRLEIRAGYAAQAARARGEMQSADDLDEIAEECRMGKGD